MTDYQFYILLATAAGPVVALGVGGAQCLLIFSGLRQMRAASRARDQLHAETMTAMESRHEQTMAAHAETMAAMERQHAENMAALKELIRRTGNGIG
ncbi:MAG: hypothetical protein F4X91_09880 [Nitrospinae bacterium]|nr:hypothetical protein [Nitrospinota bacterium]